MKYLVGLLAFMMLVLAVVFTSFSVCDAEPRYADMNRIADSYVDSVTGVVYYVIRDVRGTTNMMCVCPRYNSNGTLYTVGGISGD